MGFYQIANKAIFVLQNNCFFYLLFTLWNVTIQFLVPQIEYPLAKKVAMYTSCCKFSG